ncbi:uncharacterized protein [Hyperolius riggenbachi]|uniref:uncharacterized protein isoform X1 n=1 Tax=Hyperolius riggenbachi TaxID=752182 RepID=UPI0035A2F108
MIAVQSALVFLLCGIAQCWERVYHVRGPRSWTVGVPEAVTVEAVGYEESFPVQLSLLSYPDKKMTYDSQQLQLSPSNRHWGSTSLLINPEDFPSRDEDEQFVYLVVESDGLIKEEKLPVTDQRRSLLTPKTKQDLRERARSKRSTLLEEMLSKIIYERMKRCCSKGFAHYKKEWKCIQGMKKKKNEETERCSEMFRNCCLKAKTFSERPLQVALGDVPSSCMTGPRSWTVGVPQVISVYWFPYEECDVNNFTISLLSYPDKNITYVSKQFLAIKAGLYEEKFTLMLKHEDMPRGEMKEIAYLVAQRGTDNVEAEVLLVDRPVSSQERDPDEEDPGSWEHRQRDIEAWSDLQIYIESLKHIKVGHASSRKNTENWQGLESDLKPWRHFDYQSKAWRLLEDKIEAWKSLASKVKAWGDLQRKITALAGKYNETEEEKCWEGYRHYVRYWQCSRHMIEYLLEDTDSKAYWECCSHTRGHFWKLVAAGHVTLTNQKRRRYPVPVHIFFLDY